MSRAWTAARVSFRGAMDLPASSRPIIERFLDAMWLEHGLSDNTLKAYRSDLGALAKYLEARDVELTRVQPEHLHSYLHAQFQRNASARTVARGLSTLRRFYQYLLREGVIASDPSAEIEAPKLGRPLPASLTEAEVESLLAAPDSAQPKGQRDAAMLELLYAQSSNFRRTTPSIAYRVARAIAFQCKCRINK